MKALSIEGLLSYAITVTPHREQACGGEGISEDLCLEQAQKYARTRCFDL